MKTNSKKDECKGKFKILFIIEISQSFNSNIFLKDTKSDDENSIYMEENKSTTSIEHIKKNLEKKFNFGNETNSEFNESKIYYKFFK